MVRIDFLIFGYRKITLSPEDLSEVTSNLLRAKIPSSITNDGKITVRERDIPRVIALGITREENISKPLGLLGAIKQIHHKRAVVSALVLSMLLVIVSSLLVWDIRIEGNESIPSVSIEEELTKYGIKKGMFVAKIDESRAEVEILEENSEISWININKRGGVIYVKLAESEATKEEKVEKKGYSNVIATYDCVIEEITVKRGTAQVKKGDVVKKGDLLISGIVSSGESIDFCYAEGIVKGRVREQIVAESDRNYEKISEKSEKSAYLDIYFFNFRINIFKIYRKLQNKCDIIEEIKTFSFPNGKKLPLLLVFGKEKTYEKKTVELSDEELVRMTSELLSAKTAARLANSDLLKLKTEGEFTESGYKMTSSVVFLCSVGEDSVFYVQ